MNSPEWFERWFGEEYKRLYPHRDAVQARDQVAAVREAIRRHAPELALTSILDIGCGAGRHVAALRADPSASLITGIDLSPVLLRDARREGHAVTRADMRRLPFADHSFDLVASFFTSFGYFATSTEDAAALSEFVRVVRPGGFLFLDLPNAAVVLSTLVPSDSITIPGRTVSVTRAVEDSVVVKRIRIEHESGTIEHHEERVRLYELGVIVPLLTRAGVEVIHVMGDEVGRAFDPQTSPRMSLLLRRTTAAPEGVR
jgi:SAM-dependent methyltransferase